MGDRPLSPLTPTIAGGTTVKAPETLATIQAELETFFKDSPWRVSITNTGGEPWFTLQRYDMVMGEIAPIGDIIYLSPVSLTGPMFYYPNVQSEAPLFLIPVPDAAVLSFIDPATMTVKNKAGQIWCDTPSYLAVVQGVKKWPRGTELFIDMEKYQITPLSFEPDANGYLRFSLSKRDNNGDYIFPLYGATNIKCVPQPVEAEDEYKTEIMRLDLSRKGKWPMAVSLILDTSSSMGSLDRGYLRHVLAANLDTFLSTKIIPENTFSEKRDLNMTLKVIDRWALSVMVYVLDSVNQERLRLDAPLSEFINEPELKRLLEGDLKAFEGYVDLQKLEEWITPGLDRLLNGAEVFVGGDPPHDAIMTARKASNYHLFLSDSHGDPNAMPPSLTVELGWEGRPRDRGNVNVKDVSDAFKLSKKDGLPAFLSAIISDGYLKDAALSGDALAAQKSSDPEGEITGGGQSQVYIYHLLPRLLSVPPEERGRYYGVLEGLIEDTGNDVALRKRGVAILAAWGVKGDTKAADVLRGIFFGETQRFGMAVNTYIAKCMTLFLTEEEADGLVSAIKANPSSARNTTYLITLGGRPEFNEALRFFLNDTWSTHIVSNSAYGTLADAGKMTLTDPAVIFDYPEDIGREGIKMFIGTPWDGGEIQHLFETITARIVPTLSPFVKSFADGIYPYALTVLRPPWLRADEIRINLIPDKRYWYKLPQKTVKEMIMRVAAKAPVEEMWVTAVTEGETGYTFEAGFLSNSVTTAALTDWKFIAETVRIEGCEVTYVINDHIHPFTDLSLPFRMLLLPSDTDFLNGWLGFMAEARQRYKDAELRFRIFSPAGVTYVKPLPAMLKLIDGIIAERNGVDGEFKKFKRQIESVYLGKIDRELDLFKEDQINDALRPYFEIKFEEGLEVVK